MTMHLSAARTLILASIGLAPTLVVACGSDPAKVACEGSAATETPGVETCDNGIQHRTSVATCDSNVPRSAEEFTCGDEFGSCSTDEDCAEQANGFCDTGFDGGCFCHYGCETDADCDAGNACLCGEPVGVCVPANCQTDADCADEGLCALYQTDRECGIGTGLACTTSEDECLLDSDCAEGTICDVEVGDVRKCVDVGGCAIGRPFLIHGHPRLAAAVDGDSSWATPLSPSLADMDEQTRTALAERWTAIALMEHASIAAFARFTLQLLSVGAPAELVRDAASAMADETRHAQIAFGLASAYAKRIVGPGVLSIRGALDTNDLETFVTTLLLEGCLGETMAAIEARTDASTAPCPVVREVLETVAHDEMQHAILAWRTLAWLLSQPTLEAEVARLTHDVFAQLPGRTNDPLRTEVLREVVLPCAAQLLVARETISSTTAVFASA